MTAEIIDIIQVSLIYFFAFFGVCMPYPIFIYSFIILNNGKWKKAHKNYVNYLYVAFLLCIVVPFNYGSERYDIFASACFALASVFASAIMIKLLKIKEDICFFWSFISIIGHGIILVIISGVPPSDIAYPLIMSLVVFSGAIFCIPMIYATYRFLLLIYKRVKN